MESAARGVRELEELGAAHAGSWRLCGVCAQAASTRHSSRTEGRGRPLPRFPPGPPLWPHSPAAS